MACGIARARYLEEEKPRLEKWLKEGMHGEMGYMENHFEKRLDIRKLVPGAKSVIIFLHNYFPETPLNQHSDYKIARYAYGKDYHKVIKKKLKKLIQNLRDNYGDVSGRAFVDSAPVMERVWAKEAGLGWVGKNSLLLSKKKGSYFFLSELVLDLDLDYGEPTIDHCGSCTACMDACPTDAIPNPYVVDGSKCISYLTIELKTEIPSEFTGKMENWIFGCDICQEVCPWNRFSKPHNEKEFIPPSELFDFTNQDWQEISEEVFDKLFMGSPLKRAKYTGIKRNISHVSSSK